MGSEGSRGACWGGSHRPDHGSQGQALWGGEGTALPLAHPLGIEGEQASPCFLTAQRCLGARRCSVGQQEDPPPVLPLRQLPKHCRSGSQGRKLVSQSRPLVLGAGVWSHCHGAKTLPWSLFLPLPGACSPQNLMWAGARSVSVSVGMVPSPLSLSGCMFWVTGFLPNLQAEAARPS